VQALHKVSTNAKTTNETGSNVSRLSRRIARRVAFDLQHTRKNVMGQTAKLPTAYNRGGLLDNQFLRRFPPTIFGQRILAGVLPVAIEFPVEYD
jgi:hypothetical protein